MIRILPLAWKATVISPVFTAFAMADVARVYSGEHEDFTRLVIEMPTPTGWTVGRTPMGYGFSATGRSEPDYDLSDVWKRIPKSRLEAIRVDPETGALHMTLACSCHVFPFEYRPGVVVLDIKPGPAPGGSAFEAAFAQSVLPSGATTSMNATLDYDWLETSIGDGSPSPRAEEIALPAGETSLDPLRVELLQEISRGAAQGVVDMTLPSQPAEASATETAVLPWTQIYIGPPPDTRLDAVSESMDTRTPDGLACVPDESLDVSSWGSHRRPLDILAEARSGLYGEFDELDIQAVRRSVRLHVYLGFGAEAVQVASLIPDSGGDMELSYLRSLAHLVDGTPDPHSPFGNMHGCDGAAAFWALIAQAVPPPGVTANADAVVRSFLALPPHLRAALGPTVADRLLALEESEAARIVMNAIERTPDVRPADVALLDAKAELQAGNVEAAKEYAESAISADGTRAEEWLALVEAHFRKSEPLLAETAEVLRAFQGEFEASGRSLEFHRALALAEVLSGQTAEGFHTAKSHNVAMSDVWQVAVSMADDDSFLRAAIGPDTNSSADVLPETQILVAGRLVKLGFPDAAMAWLEPVSPGDSPDKRRVAASAEFARGDARQALVHLSGLESPDDQALIAKALVQIGRLEEARNVLLAAGMTDEALRLAAWEGAWEELMVDQTSLWTEAAAETDPSEVGDAGPLARGAAILEASAISRAAIDDLMKRMSPPGL